ncbi:MAG: hypothetical protein J4G01_06660 [Dehalococcoidia bacterium]|nr:hypothetical protein [Dehalococcoidia bacterium]
MTAMDGLRDQVPDDSSETTAAYVIDPERSKDLRRSLAAILLERRCPECRERLGDKWAEIPEATQTKEISQCCATKSGFIRPNMPMQEIVFRELLAAGNQPIGLDQLHFSVTDKWYTPTNPRNISASSLRKVLDNDLYYGLVDISAAEK